MFWWWVGFAVWKACFGIALIRNIVFDLDHGNGIRLATVECACVGLFEWCETGCVMLFKQSRRKQGCSMPGEPWVLVDHAFIGVAKAMSRYTLFDR